MTDDMMMGERDLEAEVKEKDEIIMSLRLNEHLLKDKLEVSRRNMSKQVEMINSLENENEELRENLHNCRLNKSIIREKLKLWQDVHKEYNIYSIKDFEELLNELKEENEQLLKENVFLAKQRTYWKSKCAEWMGVKEENLSLRCVNMSEKQLIFDFCDWLGGQGLLYEVIYYGSGDAIKEAIDKYLAEKEADDE